MIRYTEAKRKVEGSHLAKGHGVYRLTSMAGLDSWYGETPLEQVPVYGRKL